MIEHGQSPLMLYVHIPFCMHKCHYCDFNSHERDKPDWTGYQKALIVEMKRWAESPMFSGRSLTSIFFGGGTPSLAPSELIAGVLETAKAHFGFTESIEITLEANPGTADAARFYGYRQAGVNRLSMGVQSLNNGELQWLERIHNSNEVFTAFELARTAGFDNINMDLIFGLPDQQLRQWLDNLERAIGLGAEHLSCYQLTIEPHTKLAATHASSPLPLPNDELALAMFSETRKQLLSVGFEAYEISNFSRPGYKCRHNDGYWQYFDYIGIGAGASGKWDEQSGGISRYSNIRTPERYIGSTISTSQAINSRESLDIKQATAEAAWLAMRRTSGIDRTAFRRRFGVDPWELFASRLEPWQQQGMVVLNNDSVMLSETGITLADSIAASVF